MKHREGVLWAAGRFGVPVDDVAGQGRKPRRPRRALKNGMPCLLALGEGNAFGLEK